MSRRNSLENKGIRRQERSERKALAARQALNARVIAAALTASRGQEPVEADTPSEEYACS